MTASREAHRLHALLLPRTPNPATPTPAAPTPLSDPIRDGRPCCKWCQSEHVVKIGTKSGSQQYRCKPCGRKFVPPTGFERIQADPKAVCLAPDLSFKGLSLRKVTDTLNQFYQLDVGKSTIQRWLDRYVTLLNDYAATLAPQVGNKWHADEVFTKFSGKMQYVWHLMDAKTRYLLVSRVTEGHGGDEAKAVFTAARNLAKKNPAEVVTDGLPGHVEAFESSFATAAKTPQRDTTRPNVREGRASRWGEGTRAPGGEGRGGIPRHGPACGPVSPRRQTRPSKAPPPGGRPTPPIGDKATSKASRKYGYNARPCPPRSRPP